MIVTFTLSLHSCAIGFAYRLVGLTFNQSLIKIFQIVQESWKGQGRVMDRWVDELIDSWAHDVHFHNPLSKLPFGLER